LNQGTQLIIYGNLHMQQEITDAGDEGQRRYDEETPPQLRTGNGLSAAINNAIEAKKTKLTAPFTKYLAI
jgi:hypothetical protein